MTKPALSLLLLTALAASNCMAFGLPKLPGQGSQSSASSQDAVAMQQGVVKDYVNAARDINTAQIDLAKAFDLKDHVAVLQAEATALQSGSVDDSTIKKYQTTSESASKAIQQKINEGATLSEQGKKEYEASLIPFASGLAKTTKLPDDLKSFSAAAKSQIESASILQKAKVTHQLAAGRYLVANAPGFISNIGNSFKQIVTYAKSNKIPVPKDATNALGSL